MVATKKFDHELSSSSLVETHLNVNLITKVDKCKSNATWEMSYYAVLINGEHYEITEEQYNDLVRKFDSNVQALND